MKRHFLRVKFYTLLCFVLLILSCNDEFKLKGYYDAYQNNEEYPVGAYRFYEDGRCYYYKYNRSTNERYYWEIDDIIQDNSWNLIHDTLTLMGYPYRASQVSSDTIELKSLGRSRDKILVRSKNQKD